MLVASGAFLAGFAFYADYVSRLAPPSAGKAHADAIIVLTGGSQRIEAALDLLAQGAARRMLISGVNPAVSRDMIRNATGANKALFNCCIDIDAEALDTIGNAEESAKWLARNGYESVILVTNNYHMPRSLLELQRKARNVAVIPWPVVNTPLTNGDWMGKPQAVRVLFTEFAKYVGALAHLRIAGDVAGAKAAP